MNLRTCHKGFTLIELVLIILILGVIASVAVRNMSSSVETAQYEQTKKELDNIAYAIAGNPSVYRDGTRTDFGYIGDVGSFPPSLTALVQNPGGYSSWDGPYLVNGTGNSDYLRDSWNVDYTLFNATVRSTGSGSNIDKEIAGSVNDLLSNVIEGYLLDASNQPPGAIYNDSCQVILTYPDGTGGYALAATIPDLNGYFAFTGIPIGNHTLTVSFLPENSTHSYNISVNPGKSVRLDIVYPADLW